MRFVKLKIVARGGTIFAKDKMQVWFNASELERKTALPPTELTLLVKRLRDYATADVGKLPGEDGQP